jgi:hypothetical protein
MTRTIFMLRNTTFALAIALGVAASASAANIHYVLNLTVPGTFTLTGQTSPGDNGGIALFSVPLRANGGSQILTVDNRAPNVINSANFAPAGFSEIRSADVAAPVTATTISGSQNVVAAPPANRIYGFGQEVSSYALKSITPAFTPDATSDAAWLNPIVLAVGTYTGAPSTLAFDLQSVDLVGNAWAGAGADTAPAATITTEIILIPEPATFVLLGLAAVAGLGLRRRSA